MKSFDDFLHECRPVVESIRQDMAQYVLAHRKPNPNMNDVILLSVQVSQIYTNQLLRLYHAWLAKLLDE